MNKLFLLLLSLFPLLRGFSEGMNDSSLRLDSLYRSLDPLSISQNLGFYELYPDSKEGKRALERGWKLLAGSVPISGSTLFVQQGDLRAIISSITKQQGEKVPELTEEQLEILERICAPFGNRSLQGSKAWTEKELEELPPSEIDLGRALFIAQFAGMNDSKKKILEYEAAIDLMALQIQARLPEHPSPKQKISEINAFIFREMGFRYPPHSQDVKQIDRYTFLPSVIDGRKGVCLGVSVLYLCLAQRLHLDLEIVTPPGHIYLRHRSEEEVVNIETTARGINLPSDVYLGVNTRSLPVRNIKEVIGLVFFNEASVALGKKQFAETAKLYEKTCLYIPNDPFFVQYLGINYILAGKKKEGKKLLSSITPLTLDYAVSKETVPEDYLLGRVDSDGMALLFMPVDENRSSLVEKQILLQKMLRKYPKFRAGILQLATTFLQLGRGGEALEELLRYHKLDPSDATVEYYLAVLSLERFDYNAAWRFFQQAETLTRQRDHQPKALSSLLFELRRTCPDPSI